MRRIIAVTAALSAATVALSLPAATASAADPCLTDPVIGPGIFGEDILPALSTHNEPVGLYLWGASLAACPHVTVTARTPGGGLITVPMNQDLADDPPDYPHRVGGTLTLPLGYGAGTWQLMKITSGSSVRTLHHPFAVRRYGQVTLNAPAAVTSPTSVAVSGLVRHYTSTGSLAPSSGTKVTIYHPGREDLAYLTTGADGKFSGAIAMPPGTTSIIAEATDNSYYYPTSDQRDAVVSEGGPGGPVQVVRLLRSSTAYVNEWWRLDGTVNPGKLWNKLLVNGKSSGSFGYSAANGTFTRWWKPTTPGTYTLRIQLGTSTYREFNVTVKSKQTVPTYLDGTVTATNGGTVYRGSTMSSYGHLRVRQNSGKIGPFANQRVAVQVSSVENTAWRTVTTSGPTTSTGYFSVHWAMPYQHNTSVRFVYTSPYSTIKGASLARGTVVVQP